MPMVQAPIQELMDQLLAWMQMEEGAIPLLMVRAQHGMQMVVEPILVQMVPLVLILQMVRVLIPMQMVIHTAWMQMAMKAIREQMAHPAP